MRLTATNCGEIKVSGLNKSAESAGSVLFVSACPGCFVGSEHPLKCTERDSAAFNKCSILCCTLRTASYFAQLLRYLNNLNLCLCSVTSECYDAYWVIRI